jgi:hypothetical protein
VGDSVVETNGANDNPCTVLDSHDSLVSYIDIVIINGYVVAFDCIASLSQNTPCRLVEDKSFL